MKRLTRVESSHNSRSGTPALLRTRAAGPAVRLALPSPRGNVRRHENVACCHTSELLKHFWSLLNDRPTISILTHCVAVAVF